MSTTIRSRARRAVLLTFVALLLSSMVAPLSASARPTGRPDSAPARANVDVATYNVYLGADLNPLFAQSSFPGLVGAAGEVYAAMEATDFTERAGAIADLIAKRRPDVVGLQEVALWELAPGNVLSPTAPFVPTYDFLELLLDELAARGVPYDEVATNDNFTGSLPILLDGAPQAGFPDSTWARFTQRDVVVVRAGLPERHLSVDEDTVREANYAAEVIIPSGVAGVPDYRVPRGWSSVDVTVKGFTFRFFNTHLEAFSETVRNLQARELAAQVAASPYPPVVVGDINSRPPGCSSNTVAFQTLLDAGLVEVWPAVHRRDPCGGFTSGQAADLLNEESRLDHRIDVILFAPEHLTAIRTEVIGDEQRDRSSPTGFWPSDHAGSVATLKTVRP